MAPRPRPLPPAIVRRDPPPDLDPAAVPRDWCAGDPFRTTFAAALSLLFPEGERFFVDSVKQMRDRVEAPALAAAVAGFIAQEAMHGKGHRAFNRMLVAHGDAAAPRVEARVRRLLDLGRRALSPASQLAVTCALEHFTAILAERLLRDRRLQEDFHPAVRPLWLWHALEESEHKSVAFDLYRAAGGSTARRVAVMVMTTALFFAVLAAAQARLMATRRVLLRPWRWRRGLWSLWVWPGHFTRLVPGYLAYFRPGFHPGDRDTAALVGTWRGALFQEAA